MISINLNIRNPWSKQFKNYWSRAWDTPFKHKFIELEVYKDSSLFSFIFVHTVNQSHAGLDVELGLLGYNVHFNFYDNRHWNYDDGRWMIYTEEKGLH